MGLIFSLFRLGVSGRSATAVVLFSLLFSFLLIISSLNGRHFHAGNPEFVFFCLATYYHDSTH